MILVSDPRLWVRVKKWVISGNRLRGKKGRKEGRKKGRERKNERKKEIASRGHIEVV